MDSTIIEVNERVEPQRTYKKRSKCWDEFVILQPSETKDGKMRALCSHCDDDYNTLFSFAVILDPRYKKQFLKFCYQRLLSDDKKAQLKVSDDVLIKLEMLLKEYAPSPKTSNNSCSNNTTTFGHRNKRKSDLLEDFDKEECIDTTSTKTMLDLHLEEARVDRNMQLNVFNFWKENEKHYGELSRLARDILSVPLTTVASESTFSIGGRNLNKWRSSYLPENVEALITTRSWLYGYELTDEEEFVGSYVDWRTQM